MQQERAVIGYTVVFQRQLCVQIGIPGTTEQLDQQNVVPQRLEPDQMRLQKAEESHVGFSPLAAHSGLQLTSSSPPLATIC